MTEVPSPTPLAEKLVGLIRSTGPISVAEYMALCLGDPEHGYYRHRDPLGMAGDFITAPEISQVFGELIGVWFVAVWEAIGRPADFALVELGPGRGTLMADLLRAARVRPAFVDAAEIHLIETSPRLRAVQEQTVAPADKPIRWHENVDALPAKPLLLVANEFFDALPIRQFVRTEAGWNERVVGLDAEGRLAFGLTAAVLPIGEDTPASSEIGAVREVRPAGEALIGEIAYRIATNGGAALVIDYGHAEPGLGDTLQAVRAHRYDEVLAHPGEADLSAHVDFAALRAAAGSAGARTGPILTQADFLRRLGLAARVDRLAERADARAEQIRGAALRLVDPNEMGHLFKVLGVGEKSHVLPAFDND